jgi:RHS repeat-associated protein
MVSKSGDATNTWDFEDRLTKVTKTDGTVVAHVYDVDGNRVKTIVTGPGATSGVTNFLVDIADGLSRVVAETDAIGAVQAYYVRAGGQLLAVRRGPSQARYFLADGLGSVRALADGMGTTTDTKSYTAYGETLAHSGSDSQPYGFAGEAFDGVSGLSYNRARWMDPNTGTFLTYDHGPPTGYRYGRGNPVNMVDPSGFQSVAEVGVIVAITSSLASCATTTPGIGAKNASNNALTWRQVRPPWKGIGGYLWDIIWSLDRESSSGGFIIQHVDVTFEIATGPPLARGNYWEAWQVSAKSKITTQRQIDAAFNGVDESDMYDDRYQYSGFNRTGTAHYRADAIFYEGPIALPKSFSVNNPLCPKYAGNILPCSPVPPAWRPGEATETKPVDHSKDLPWP